MHLDVVSPSLTKDVQDARVMFGIRFGLGVERGRLTCGVKEGSYGRGNDWDVVQNGVFRFELGKAESESQGVANSGFRSCSDNHTAVREGGGTGEVLREPTYEGEIVSVDELEGGGAVLGLFHGEAKTIQGHKDRRARMLLCRGCGEFSPEKLENWPGYFRILGAQVRQAGEGDVGLERYGERFWRDPGERHVRENRIGTHDCGKKGGEVGFLDISWWCRARERGVVCVSNCEIHG